MIIRLDLHLTANFVSKQLLVTECTIVDATMTSQAIVLAFMKTTLYAKQITVVTFRLAELNAGPEIDHYAVEHSA